MPFEAGLVCNFCESHQPALLKQHMQAQYFSCRPFEVVRAADVYHYKNRHFLATVD